MLEMDVDRGPTGVIELPGTVDDDDETPGYGGGL